jgi:tripartite-type tricarboxylate transporter receptor subunit TctC
VGSQEKHGSNSVSGDKLEASTQIPAGGLAGLRPARRRHALHGSGPAFPSKPIKLIVPFGPGSGTDTSARYFGRKLQELTGQPVVVENKAGANGFIAVKQVLSAPADGYTVFIGSNSTLAVNAALFRHLPYDPLTDFAPLTMMMRSPAMLAVMPQAAYSDLKGLISHARANPGKVNFGAGSAGYQLMGELFNDAARIETVHVPFKGRGNHHGRRFRDGGLHLRGSHGSAGTGPGGRVKVLAVASDKRVSTSPRSPRPRRPVCPDSRPTPGWVPW